MEEKPDKCKDIWGPYNLHSIGETTSSLFYVILNHSQQGGLHCQGSWVLMEYKIGDTGDKT